MINTAACGSGQVGYYGTSALVVTARLTMFSSGNQQEAHSPAAALLRGAYSFFRPEIYAKYP
jgi:hypothetical protein